MANASHDLRGGAGSQRVWCGALFALTGSIAVLVLVSSAPLAPVLYWVLTSVALLTALAIIAAGECLWERAVADTRAAGVVAR